MTNRLIPNHVAIIADGNGRWAVKRNKIRSLGHLAGSKNFEKLALHALKLGIKVLSIFVFSTENFKRSDDEVNYLMDLFIKAITTRFKKIEENNIKVIFSGRQSNLRPELIKSMNTLVEKTKNNTNGILNICLNYGGQQEIVDATKTICQKVVDKELSTNEINENSFYQYLYQNLPPIDLLIRTAGEYRISNFMLYQASYAEFYFTNELFPDFNGKELEKAINEFNKRDRRFGGVKS